MGGKIVRERGIGYFALCRQICRRVSPKFISDFQYIIKNKDAIFPKIYKRFNINNQKVKTYNYNITQTKLDIHNDVMISDYCSSKHVLTKMVFESIDAYHQLEI